MRRGLRGNYDRLVIEEAELRTSKALNLGTELHD
jgi:hypothetical protein